MPHHVVVPPWAIPFFSPTLQKLFDVSIYREICNLFNGKPDYQTEELMKMLQVRLCCVRAALDEADEEKIMNPNVTVWAEKLQEALDDAENLWDLIVTENSRYKSYSSSDTPGGKITEHFQFVKPRLEDIIKRLFEVVNMKNVTDLKEGKERRESVLSLPTTSFLDYWEPLHGRDSDKRILTPYLSLENKDIIIVAIVGMAGIGKTALARHLFHFPGPFNLKHWIYVSVKSNVLDLTKKIYASVTSSKTEITDLDLLQEKLSSELTGKKFLLVFDDFWSEEPHDWNLFKGPLTSGAPGSVIIVTTQNENVARTLRATVIHTLPLLKDEDSLEIFKYHAFGINGAVKDERLAEIAKKIVEKYKGHPLSAKVLGSLLHSTDDALEWDNILHSKIWDLPANRSNILLSLLVSYQHLPLHLKRCFAFCSMTPKGQPTKKWKLISLWIAHDLLPQSKIGKTVEQVGNEYLHELMSKSFLQQSKKNDWDFEMHDLMRELAQYVGGQTFFKLEVGNVHDIPKMVRHLSFSQDKIDKPENLRAFHSHSQFRTLLSFKQDSSGASNSLTHGSFETPLKELPSLRVLSLENFKISELPNSIENLKHLRYLNLSKTEIDKLPFLESLPNLVTLLLSECGKLTELPADLPKLINLRHLDVSGTPLKHMPPNFGELKSLQILTTFFASANTNASRVSELGKFTQLCGTLSIVDLQNVRSATEASQARLKEMKFLRELNLKWRGQVQPEAENAVVHELEPHKVLQTLKVERYCGREFPQWLGLPSFSNMVSVYLIDCCHCSTLPPLGQLCSLKTLYIKSMTSLQRVNPEFYGTSHSTPFRSLKNLSFIGMRQWTEWPRKEFPSLQELHIQGCPNLTGNLNHQMPLLNKLKIWECSRLQLFPVEHGALELQELEYFHLRCSCETLDSFQLSSFPKLCDLRIQSCDSLRSLSIPPQFPQHHGSLQNLVLDDCPKFDSIFAGGWEIPNLNSLKISDCPLLVQRFQSDAAYQELRSGLGNNFFII